MRRLNEDGKKKTIDLNYDELHYIADIVYVILEVDGPSPERLIVSAYTVIVWQLDDMKEGEQRSLLLTTRERFALWLCLDSYREFLEVTDKPAKEIEEHHALMSKIGGLK